MNDRERHMKFMQEIEDEIADSKKRMEERWQAEQERMRQQTRLAEWGWIEGVTGTIDNLGKNVRRRR